MRSDPRLDSFATIDLIHFNQISSLTLHNNFYLNWTQKKRNQTTIKKNITGHNKARGMYVYTTMISEQLVLLLVVWDENALLFVESASKC